MEKEALFEGINLGGKYILSEKIKVESKTETPSDTIEKVFSVSCSPMSVKGESVEGGVKYEGKLAFYVCYEDAEGNFNKTECGTEFKGIIRSEKPKGKESVLMFAVINKVDSDASGLNLAVSAQIEIVSQVYEERSVKALVGGEDLVVKNGKIISSEFLPVLSTVYPLEEEATFDYVIEKVLCHRAEAVVITAQCGVGEIIVDGEVRISSILQKAGKEKQLVRENVTFPFRAEIEYESATPTDNCQARAQVKSFKTDITADRDKSVSVANVSISLIIEGLVNSCQEKDVAVDLFSIKNQVEITRKKEDACKLYSECGLPVSVNGKCAVDTLPSGSILCATFGERAEIVSIEERETGIEVSGVLTTTAIFINEDGKTFTRKLETPFLKEIECEKELKTEVSAVAYNSTATVNTESEITASAEVLLTVSSYECIKTEYIESVKFLSEKEEETSALSVYIPVRGEELWSLSKRLNVTPEKLSETNPELVFPLNGDERIVVYRPYIKD